MNIEPSALLTVLSLAGGGIAWLLRLESRMSATEAQHKAVAAWLSRVEAKLDRVIEGRR